MTPIEYVAHLLLLPSALFARREAPFVSLSLLLAFIANLAYANGIVTSESIRWISALVGLDGAIEFGRGVERTKVRVPVSIPDAIRKVDGGTWIGCLVMASMGVDGFGMIVYRRFDMWIVPETTIVILVMVCSVGLFGKENEG